MMTNWLCRQGEHGKIEFEDTQMAVETLRGMMVMDNDHRSPIPSAGHYERRLFDPPQEVPQAIAEVILDRLSNHS